MKLGCSIVFFCFVQILAFAQNNSIDSLQKLLNIHPQKDTVRIKILNELAFEIRGTDKTNCFKYLHESDSISSILNYPKGKAESLRIIGTYYHLKSDFSAAMTNFEKALKIYEENGIKSGIATCYNNIGIIYNLKGDLTKALDYFQKALKIFKLINDKTGAANCYNSFGIIYYLQGDYPKSLEYYQKALSLNEVMGIKGAISRNYNNIGNIYNFQGEYSKALTYYSKALVLNHEINNNSGIADSYVSIGNTYKAKLNFKTALEYYQKSLKIRSELGDKRGMANSCYYIGDIYFLTNDYLKAAEFYNQSVNISIEIGEKTFEAYGYKAQSNLLIKEKKYNQAYHIAKKGYEIALNLKLAKLISETAEILAISAYESGMYKSAYDYHVIFKNKSDSLLNKEKIIKLASIEYLYKHEKDKQIQEIEKQKQEALFQEEIKNQETLRNSFMIGFVLAFLLVFFIFRMYKNKKKSNQLLAIQRNEIALKNTELIQQKEEIQAQNKTLQEQKKITEQAFQNIKILNEIGKEITINLSIEKIIETVYEKVNNLMDATVFAIGLYEAETNRIHVQMKEDNVYLEPFYYELSDKDRLAVICFENKEEIFINNMAVEYVKYINKRKKPVTGKYVSSILYLPLLFQNKCLGTISVQSYHINAYTQNHLHLIRNIAIYASIAFENARNYNKIENQKNLLIKQKKSITDSIVYASRIQQALLPQEEIINFMFPQNFILFKPRNIVSGDFYWAKQVNKYKLIAAADCTGHGVPGAFMSMLGISILNEIVSARNAKFPNHILNEMRIFIKNLLRQKGEDKEQHDGLDIAFCTLDSDTKKLYYSGANNPLWIVRNNQSDTRLLNHTFRLIEYKADKMPVGYHLKEESFLSHEIQLNTGDLLYIFSDGYHSQFGGLSGEKMFAKRFQDIILSIAEKPMSEQKQLLEHKLNSWQGTFWEQVDDILVIGIQI